MDFDLNDTSELKYIFDELLGGYSYRTYEDVVVLGDGEYTTVERPVEGIAGLDFRFISGVLYLFLITYCLFRLLGGIFTHK